MRDTGGAKTVIRILEVHGISVISFTFSLCFYISVTGDASPAGSVDHRCCRALFVRQLKTKTITANNSGSAEFDRGKQRPYHTMCAKDIQESDKETPIRSVLGRGQFSRGRWYCECEQAARCLTTKKSGLNQGKRCMLSFFAQLSRS
jgi:hypothetical protein